MAEKKQVPRKQETQKDKQVLQQPPTEKRRASIFKLIIIVLVLLFVIGVGFAAGIYLKLIDLPKIANNLNLSEYPVIGNYFPKQQINFEPVEVDDNKQTDSVFPSISATPPPTTAAQTSSIIPPVSIPKQNNMLTLEDIEKEAKRKQQEEAKRISKLARLYSGMKPEEAVAIMKELDANTVIAIFGKMEDEQAAKIMALFAPARAADLTREMLRGQRQPTNL